jgi:hypothetical protein
VAVRIEVRLRGGEQRDEALFFEPGDEVAGSVVVEADVDTECRGIWVRLIWHTEGRGDQDIGKIDEVSLSSGRLTPGAPAGGDFRFRLPSEPWSFAGHYVSIVWAIEVTVNVPMARDPVHRERFVMRPRQAR